MNSSSPREKNSILKSLVALVLIAGCLWAAQWQYHRGQDRHQRNAMIESNLSKPERPLSQLKVKPTQYEWRPVAVTGEFDSTSQILLRNHYFEGVYGFELLTRFTDLTGATFWVDCGWVKAGANASTQPELPVTAAGVLSISGRLRLDSSLPRGSFFAIPSNGSAGLISKANAQSGSLTENFYIDLLSGSDPALTPTVPAQLPELSDGPHMAYALQWIFFASLAAYGRYLIRRDVLTSKEF